VTESLRWRRSYSFDLSLNCFPEEAPQQVILATTHPRATDLRLPCTTTNNIFLATEIAISETSTIQ
jgi:hypothetical protein